MLTKMKSFFDWKDWLAIGAGVCGTLAQGFSHITKGSIWFDEAFSEHITRHSFFDIAHYTALDVHPPLYYWALKFWRSLFGSSEVALRSLSLFFLAAIVVAVYMLVRRHFTRQAAMLAMLFVSLSPMLIRYGVEARMYTMEAFIVVAATGVLLTAVRSRRTWPWIIYGALVGLGLLTHYLSAVVWIAHAVWLYLEMRQKTVKATLIKMLKSKYKFSALAGIAVSLVWLPFMITQLVHIQGGGFWIKAVTMNTLPNYASNMYTYHDSSGATGWMAVGLVVALALSARLVYVAVKQATGERRQAYTLMVTGAVVPPILLILGSMPPLRSSFVDRYLLPSIVLWFVVVAVAIVQVRLSRKLNSVPGVTLIITLVLLALGSLQALAVGNLNKDNNSTHNMRTAMQLISQHAQPNEPILADSSWKYYEASYYETPEHTVYFRSEDQTKIGAYAMLRDETKNKVLDINAFGRQHKSAWFITTQPRNTGSRIPKDWREIKTYLVEGSQELRVVKMEYAGQ